jgi:hypothetical protein
MLALQDLFAEEWHEATIDDDIQEKQAIFKIAVFFLLGCRNSLHGFQLPKIVLHKLVWQMLQMEDEGNIPAHIGVPLRGKLKARSSIIVEIICYTVAKTHSGLNPGFWVSRLVDVLKTLGITSGWLFKDKKQAPRKMYSFSKAFYGHLLAHTHKRSILV